MKAKDLIEILKVHPEATVYLDAPVIGSLDEVSFEDETFFLRVKAPCECEEHA